MPIAKIGTRRKGKFRCETPEEVKIIDNVQDEYCKKHDNYEFVKEFFNICSYHPGQYVRSVKKGSIAISPELWVKITNYYQRFKP